VFLLNEILWSLPFILYAGFRVRRLIARRPLKDLFTAFFVYLVLGFPLASYLSHKSWGSWTLPVISGGYYALPLLLYLVLFVVGADLLLGLLRLTGLLSRETVRRPAFRGARLGAYLGVPVLVVAAGIWNFHTLRVKPYSLSVPRRSADVSRVRIVFAADFHLGEQTAPHFLERFVALANAQGPDVVLLGGDILERDRRPEDLRRFAALFRSLRAPRGVYAVPGNHEAYAGGRADFFTAAGIRLLRDEVVKVDGAFYLVGRDDGRRRGRLPVADLLKDTPRDLPLVILAHRPVDLADVSRSGADVSLSGHTHHGQLFPVNFITRHRYEIDWGYKKKGPTHVFVTSGIQLWGPRVRTAGHSEMLVLDLSLD
jgi:predicted MPP superfamily phosphohydrolase